MVEQSEKNIPSQVKRLAAVRKTPFLAMNRRIIGEKFTRLRRALTGVRVYYAIKANPHRRLIQMLHAMGAGFEVASEEEMNLVLGCGVSSREIITSNPLKSVSFIGAAHHAGVEYFAFDSYAEVDKLSAHAPGCKGYVRLVVPNEGSQWPLSRKFGVETAEAIELLEYAATRKVIPYGITFHVGSQCLSQSSWINAIKKSKVVWEAVRNRGIELRMLNIGGGFPIEYATDSIPPVDELGRVIGRTLKDEFPPSIEIFAEPGRLIVGEAGTMVSTVVAKARREEENWLYLDIGVFTGLMESIGGIQYPFLTLKDGPQMTWVVAGPTCDSMDVIAKQVSLPDLAVGEKVYIPSAGAYTTAYASRFNGFSLPRIYLY